MGDRLEPGLRYNTPEPKFVQTPSLSDETKNNHETLKSLASLPILMLFHSGGDNAVLGVAPASTTSWDLGPRLHVRFGVSGTLNSMKQQQQRLPLHFSVSRLGLASFKAIESNDCPEIPDRGETSEMLGFPSGQKNGGIYIIDIEMKGREREK